MKVSSPLQTCIVIDTNVIVSALTFSNSPTILRNFYDNPSTIPTNY